MCNHYHAHLEAMKAMDAWKTFLTDSGTERLNEAATDVWPRRQALVGRKIEGRKSLDIMAWGVPLTVPGKRPGTTVTKHVTNVRNLDSPFWRSMLVTPAQRCLVPFSAFAEPKPDAGREEVWFTVKESPVAAFAGIWRQSDEGKVFAFLTCASNPLVAPIHLKAMPAILHFEDYDPWLDGADAQKLAVPFPSQLMMLAYLGSPRRTDAAPAARAAEQFAR